MTAQPRMTLTKIPRRKMALALPAVAGWSTGNPTLLSSAVHQQAEDHQTRAFTLLWAALQVPQLTLSSILPPGLVAGAGRRFQSAQLTQEGTFSRAAHSLQRLLWSGQKAGKRAAHLGLEK